MRSENLRYLEHAKCVRLATIRPRKSHEFEKFISEPGVAKKATEATPIAKNATFFVSDSADFSSPISVSVVVSGALSVLVVALACGAL